MPQAADSGDVSNPDWAAIQTVLASSGVPMRLQLELKQKLDGTFDGLLLYGSWARGDADDSSDLDVIALGHTGPELEFGGDVSLSRYSEDELLKASGTLFGFHLARDGQVLFERDGRLSRILANLQAPEPGRVLARIRSLTPVLDVPAKDEGEYVEGLTQVARYLVRSALYAEALDEGQPCFSVREIAARKDDAALATVLSSHSTVRPSASPSVLADLRRRLIHVIGPLQANKYGDLHGLIEGAWEGDRDLSNFATLALGQDDELPYDELPKVVL